MAVFDSVSKEVKSIISMVILIVIGSVILLKFLTVDNVSCTSLYTYNATAENCYLTTNSSVTAAVEPTHATINTAVTAISEPISWIIIAVVGLIGFTLFKLYSSKQQ